MAVSLWDRKGGSEDVEGEGHVKTKAESAKDCRQTPEAGHGMDSPSKHPKATNLPIPWFWTFGPWTVRINICCLKPTSWWQFVTTSLGNRYSVKGKWQNISGEIEDLKKHRDIPGS